MNKYTRIGLVAGLLVSHLRRSRRGQQAAKVDCKMKFSMSGWSAFYKRADGTGTVTCNNGQTANVKLEARGGGLTAGKSSIENGTGEFSNVKNIDEIFGKYVNAEAQRGRREVIRRAGDDQGRSLAGAGRHRPRLGPRHLLRQVHDQARQ